MSTAVLWAAFVPGRPCTTCKPGPDGSPAIGWALIAFGAATVVAAIVVLAFAGRSKADPDDASAEPAEPVAMDRAQREDLEQRAAKETEERDRTQVNLAGGLAVAGVGCAVVGIFLTAVTLSAVNDHKKQLHDAASAFVSVAIDGPENCQEMASIPVPVPSPSPSSAKNVVPKPHCSASPRDYVGVMTDENLVYTEFKLETVFSENFRSDGEVTFHDTLNKRALCVRVPDTNASTDLDSFITSGACPDAPVTDPPGQ